MSLHTYRARRDQHHQPEKSFWLEFQVCSDGSTPSSSSSSSSSSSPHQHFHLFPSLPTELRLKIWESLLLPRVVIAACLDASDPAATRAQLSRRPSLRRVPALLHVSPETRRLALRRYRLAFAWRVPPHHITMADDQRHRHRHPARVWFDFERDTLLLMGELEPPGEGGVVNAPVVYFLDRADARRVRHVACAFEALRLGDVDAEAVFGCLFHVVDGFPAAERLVITSTDEDVRRHWELRSGDGGRGGVPLDFGWGRRENLVQKIWWAWVNGMSAVNNHLRDKQILMVREDRLADFEAEVS